MEQSRGFGLVGGCHADSSGHGFHYRQNGEWRCRQYADNHLSVWQSSCVCGSGDGFGYVCSSVHQKNLETLRSYGNHIIEPGTRAGEPFIAGKGRMEEPDVIIRHLEQFFAAKDGDLAGKKL